MTKKQANPPPRCTVLESATPYPWRRNYKGDLCGAGGQPIYFQGSDAVLVEHSPLMLEALLRISKAARPNRPDSKAALREIRRFADRLVSQMRASYQDRQWCRGTIDSD